MSSHHVIRDGQEPPLLIINPETIEYPVMGELLEWSPYVMCLGHCVDALRAKGIKIDHIFSQGSGQPPALPYAVSRQGWNTREELMKRVNEKMLALNNRQVCVLTDDPMRLQQWTSLPGVIIFDREHKWTYHRNAFRKWFPAGTVVKISGNCYFTGDVEERQDELMVSKDGMIKLVADPAFWLGEPY